MSEKPSIGSPQPRCERVFTLRVWREGGSRPGDRLRGSVLDVVSGQRFFFSSLTDLSDFLQLRLGSGNEPDE